MKKSTWTDQYLEPRTQDLAGFKILLCSKPNKKIMFECDGVTKSSHVYQVPGKSSHFWKYYKKKFETWQRHIEPGFWRNVTRMWRCIISSLSLTSTQVQTVQVLGKFRLGTTLTLQNWYVFMLYLDFKIESVSTTRTYHDVYKHMTWISGVPSSRATCGFPQYCVSTCVRFGCTRYAQKMQFTGTIKKLASLVP